MNVVYLAKIANAGKAYRLVHLLLWDFYSVSYVKQDILCATAKQPFVHNTSNRTVSLCLMNYNWKIFTYFKLVKNIKLPTEKLDGLVLDRIYMLFIFLYLLFFSE